MGIAFQSNFRFEISGEQQAIVAVGLLIKSTANDIAPIDDGDLRKEVEERVGLLAYNAYWVVPYASVRYETNYANPETTRWVAKAITKLSGQPIRNEVMKYLTIK